MTTPKYSICMCNYNMADTIETSLTSIAEQLNDQFEIIVVDDGSSDKSVDVLRSLQKRFPFIRIVELARDPKRMLGFTRNVSVENARGEYVLLHIDCDDIYDRHIIDFTKVFHQIEQCMNKDIILSGLHVNMGKREFLLKYGPYRNIFYTEDRDMWIRFASINAYIPLQHVDFVTRIPKTKRDRTWRSLVYTWRILQNDFRSGATLYSHIKYESQKLKVLSLKLLVYRALILIPVFISAKFHERITVPENMDTPEKILEYRKEYSGTFTELTKRFNCKPDFSNMSTNAKNIFI